MAFGIFADQTGTVKSSRRLVDSCNLYVATPWSLLESLATETSCPHPSALHYHGLGWRRQEMISSMCDWGYIWNIIQDQIICVALSVSIQCRNDHCLMWAWAPPGHQRNPAHTNYWQMAPHNTYTSTYSQSYTSQLPGVQKRLVNFSGLYHSHFLDFSQCFGLFMP